MHRRDRVAVTVSPAMRLALEHLAQRNSLTISAEATLLLRQALDRTIASAPVQAALKQHNAQRSWANAQGDAVVEHAVEQLWSPDSEHAKEDAGWRPPTVPASRV